MNSEPWSASAVGAGPRGGGFRLTGVSCSEPAFGGGGSSAKRWLGPCVAVRLAMKTSQEMIRLMTVNLPSSKILHSLPVPEEKHKMLGWQQNKAVVAHLSATPDQKGSF